MLERLRHTPVRIADVFLDFAFLPWGIRRHHFDFRFEGTVGPATESIAGVLDQAGSSVMVKMADPDVHRRFHNDVLITDAFDELARRGVEIEFLFPTEFDPRLSQPFRLEREGKAKVWRKEGLSGPSYWLVDDRHIAYIESQEQPHATDRTIYILTDPRIARVHRQNFEAAINLLEAAP